MNNYTANQVADWFLSKINVEAGDSMTPLKLQKLVYYAQAWSVTVFNESLFNEPIEAWVHGPVIPSLYKKYAGHCISCNIPIDKIKEPRFDSKTSRLLKEIMQIYGEHSSSYLEELTHNEEPWKDARKGLKPFEKSKAKISHKSMKEYYSKKLHGG